MSTTADHTLYVGTDDGLYQATPNGDRWHHRLVGLQGQGGVRSLAIDPDEPDRFFACTGTGGMFRSEDAGEKWSEINQGIVYKEGWSLTQHPSTGDLWYGAGPSSVFKSTDRGDSWQECSEIRRLPTTKEWDFPTPPHVSHVRFLATRADDPAVVMGAVEVGWLIRSDDGGATWENLSEGIERDTHSITFMPDDPDVIVATTGVGIYRSTNGGRTFADARSGLTHVYMTQIVMHASRPDVLFTAGAETPPGSWFRRPEGAATGFYRSDDQGRSWQRLYGGLPDLIKPAPRAVTGDPEDPDAFYVGMIDGSVWLTENGGDAFRQVVVDLPGWVRWMHVAHR